MSNTITISNIPMRMKVRDLISLLEQSVLDLDQKVLFTIEFYSDDDKQVDILHDYLNKEILTRVVRNFKL